MMQGIQAYMFEPLKKDYPDDSNEDRYYSDSDQNGSDYEPPDPREEYSDGLLRQLKRFQGKATFSDVTIKVAGTEFHGHRCVLAAASTFFEDMFSAGLKESDVVEIKDMDADVFKKIWKFIYSGGMDVDKDTMPLFKASVYLGLRDVERVFMNHYIEGLKWGDVGAVEALAIWPTVIDSNMSRLRAGVVKHLLEDFQKILKSDVNQFVERAPAQLITGYLKDFTKYLTSDLTEEQLLTYIVRWLKHDWEKRKRHAHKILKKFRLGSLPKDIVQQLMDADILEIPESQSVIKIRFGLVDIPWKQYLTESKSSCLSSSSTRGNFTKFILPQPNTVLYENTYFPRTIRDWNNLTIDPAEYRSLEAFKSALRDPPLKK